MKEEERLVQINGKKCEEIFIKTLSDFLSIQERLSVEPPFFAMVSLLGVSGYVLEPIGIVMKSDLRRKYEYPIDRDTLLLPEIMIDSFEKEPAEVMKPIFDALWNASGGPGSPYYGEDGKRKSGLRNRS